MEPLNAEKSAAFVHQAYCRYLDQRRWKTKALPVAFVLTGVLFMMLAFDPIFADRGSLLLVVLLAGPFVVFTGFLLVETQLLPHLQFKKMMKPFVQQLDSDGRGMYHRCIGFLKSGHKESAAVLPEGHSRD